MEIYKRVENTNSTKVKEAKKMVMYRQLQPLI